MTIELTNTQVDNLIEFFELGFIDYIKADPDLDNLDYLVDMCEIYTKLKEVHNNESV